MDNPTRHRMDAGPRRSTGVQSDLWGNVDLSPDGQGLDQPGMEAAENQHCLDGTGCPPAHICYCRWIAGGW